MGKTKTAFVSGMPEEPEKPKGTSGPEGLRPGGKPKKAAKEKPEKVHIAGLKGGQRIKTIEATPVVTEEPAAEAKEGGRKKARPPKVRGKKYKEAKAKVDRNRFYPLADAIKLAKETSYSKFGGSVEIHLNVRKLGLSARVSLPHSAGKEKKVEIASDETIEKLKSGKIDFDVLLATADMMPKLVPFAKVLGPKGLMPNPKNETLIKDKKAAEKFSANAITLKTQKDFPVIHSVVGKVGQEEKELLENIKTIIEAIGEKQVTSAFIKASMGPSIKLAVS